ncbi:phospholipase D-like domain-containing protein [Bdellovibrio sp. HCB2-146]|uniref:phospholipase D-like domain-containing protein n=1 Tax=Bdellovibrio sp. HCB2-146 TaxID=3394362 RepID=UPI0039BC30B8
MKLLISLALVLSFTVHAQAQSVSIKERLEAAEFYKKNFNTLFGPEACRRSETLLEQVKKLSSNEQKIVRQYVRDHEDFVPEKVLLPYVYWKYVKKSEPQVQIVLQFWLQQRLQALRDYADHPLKKDKAAQAAARDLMMKWSQARATNPRQPELSENLKKRFPEMDNYSLSAIGFVPGNIVELVSHNEVSPERIQWFNDRVIFAGGVLDFNQPYMKMPLSSTDEGHPSFKDPMFAKIRDMILTAKQSVFIDIFLFGGTMGGTLSKFLLDQAIEKKKQNPNFKVLLLHDYATNYNMKEEMMPIFQYIKDRIEKEPALKGSVYMLQANIQRHPPGIPFGITNLIPKTEETFKNLEKRNTYYESKIDHSKVIVIDAEGDAPEAYFGSKNWSDHSGGYYYDNAIYVKGPMAAVVQAAYYDDVDAALTTDPNEKKWFFFKERGFANEAYLPIRKEILEWFRVKRTSYPAVGDQVVRLAEANVDGKIKDVRNILVDMISKAESHIYMEQLFIYDKYINDALMKRKAQVPGLKIRILADHNGNFHLGGLPNTLFLEQMLKHGVEIKARRTLGIEAKFPNGTTQGYHQENHRKITSVDGKVILGGSSNLNPDTLQGSFREFGAQIYDTKVIAGFEKEFEAAWNDNEQTGPFFEGDRLQLQVLGKTLSPEQSSLLNNLGATILRAKDDLEKR